MFNFFNKNKTKVFLYNTLGRKKEEFKPIKKGQISFYQCGPTVYWTQHIGNMRAMVMADIVNRTFDYLGYKVKFVRNYTDVGHLTSDGDSGEDKILKTSQKEGLKPEEIANKYISLFESDINDLNITEPSFKPKATEYVDEMINLVKILLQKGFAYETNLAVYFDVSKARDYTKLSGQDLEKNISGKGAGDVEDPGKKNPADFSLWFFKAGKHQNALQYWKSPFKSSLVKDGEGFPGWHIECSAMTRKLLGKTIDIHMGGIEHIPVHHTNEIAQSESANGAKFVDYWLHNEWLTVNGGKMSKSEGTAYSLSEVKEKGFNPLSLRFFFLQAHYRSPQNFTWEALTSADNGYKNLINHISSLGDKVGKINQEYKKEFIDKISDDLNIPQALAVLFDMLKSNIKDSDKLATILDFDNVFGLKLKSYVSDKSKIPAEVEKFVIQREEARKNKDWARSDELRDKIKDLGYDIKDSVEGQKIIKLI